MLSKTELASAPFLPVALCFSFGIALFSFTGWIWWPIAFLFVSAVGLFFINRYVTLLCIVALLGFCDAGVSFDTEADVSLCGKVYVYKGRVLDAAEGAGSRVLEVRLDEAGQSPETLRRIRHVKAKTVIPGFTPEISKGETLIFRARYDIIDNRSDLPEELTPYILNARKHIYLQAQITDADIIAMTPSGGFNGWCQKQHNRLIEIIGQSGLTTQAKELMMAMIGGDGDVVSERIRVSFSISGLSHILALSGLHVGIIAAIVTLGLWPLYFAGGGRIRTITVIVVLWLFALLTGMGPSVVRATVMATVYMSGRLLYRRTSALNSLAVAAVAILLFAPDSLFEAGFQLSFAAVLSIIVFAERFNPVSRRCRLLYSIVSFLSVTVSAVLGTALLSAIYFHSFPIYFLLANSVASILVAPALAGGIMLVLLGWAGITVDLLTKGVNLMCSAITGVADSISELPGAAVSGFYFEAWTVVPMLLFLAALKMLLDSRDGKRWTLFAAMCAVIVITLSLSRHVDAENRIYLLRNTYHTEIAFAEGDSVLRLVSTAPAAVNDVTSVAEVRYSNYLSRRGLKGVELDTLNRSSDRCVTAGNLRIGLLSGKQENLPGRKLTHAVLCRGYRGDVELVRNTYSPDTVLLSYDLHPRRAMHYKEQCDTLGIPCVWLREKAWSIAFDKSCPPSIE